jgi:hypothetical protein
MFATEISFVRVGCDPVLAYTVNAGGNGFAQMVIEFAFALYGKCESIFADCIFEPPNSL